MEQATGTAARRVTCWVLAIVLLASPVAAQKSVFVEGLTELTRAMLDMADDPARLDAAIDTMAASLAGWQAPSPTPIGVSLFDDDRTDLPLLPLAAYADGFGRILRGEYRDAIASLRRAARSGAGERSQLIAAGILAQQGQHVEAERALRAIVAAFPQSGVAHWWLARECENLHQVSEARREYELVVGVALAGRAPLYEAIGRLARDDGDLVRATEAFARRVQLRPNSPAAHRDLASVYVEQDRTDEALAEWRTAVSIEPRDAEAHVGIGRIHLNAGRPADAIAELRRALDLRPELFEARYALALALKQTGRTEEAAREIELFERARRETTEDRRRTMAADVRKEEAARQDRGR